MSKTTDPNALRSLAQGLSAVAARLDPKEAAEAAATLTQAMSKTTDPIAMKLSGGGPIGGSGPPGSEGGRRGRRRPHPGHDDQDRHDLGTSLIERLAAESPGAGLSAVAARLDPKEAAEAAAALTQAMSKTTNPDTNSLAKSLSAVLSPRSLRRPKSNSQA